MKRNLLSCFIASVGLFFSLATQASVMTKTDSICNPETQPCLQVNGLDARMLKTPFGDTHGPQFNFTYDGVTSIGFFSDDTITAGGTAYLPVDPGLQALNSAFVEMGASCVLNTIKPVPATGVYAVANYQGHFCSSKRCIYYSCTITG